MIDKQGDLLYKCAPWLLGLVFVAFVLLCAGVVSDLFYMCVFVPIAAWFLVEYVVVHLSRRRS